MILAFRHTPGASAEHTNEQDPDYWLCMGTFRDLQHLGEADDGEYAVFEPSKAEAEPGLPKTFTFENRVKVTTPAPKPSVRTV